MFKENLTKDGEKLIAESIAGRAKIQFTKLEEYEKGWCLLH